MTEFWDKRSKQFLVLSGAVLLLIVSLRFAKYFADILAIVGISIVIAYLLIGPVDFLTKIVRFRAIAVMLTYLILLGCLGAVFIFVAPKVIKEFGEFTTEIPKIFSYLDHKVNNIQIFLNKDNVPINLSNSY